MNILEKKLREIFGTPSPKQERFLKSTKRYIGYGGAKGGGKSHAIRAKATYLAYEWPGIQMLIVRKTLPELRENHTTRLKLAFGQLPQGCRPWYRVSDREFIWPGGSRLKLGYCNTEDDVGRYQGQEYDVLFVDEATQQSENQFHWLDACVRGANHYPKRTYLTCNPGGVGHGWVKKLFIDRDYTRGQRPEDYEFIQAFVWDNLAMFETDYGYRAAVRSIAENNPWFTHGLIREIFYNPATVKTLPKEQQIVTELIDEARWEAAYVRNLDSLPGALRKAWLEGDWNVFAGQYFGEFHEQTHTCDPFAIPKDWRKSVALDYGLDMLAALWFAVSPQGEVVCYRGHEAPDLTISQAAKRIRELSGDDRIGEYIAPPDLWNRRQDTGKSAAATFAENGVPLIKAGNARIDGWLQVKEYLKAADGTPRLKIFNRGCEDIIRCLPLLQHDTKRPSDVAVQPHDITHSPDALRYWCSLRQLSTAMQRSKPIYNFACERPKVQGYEVTDDYLTGGY